MGTRRQFPQVLRRKKGGPDRFILFCGGQAAEAADGSADVQEHHDRNGDQGGKQPGLRLGIPGQEPHRRSGRVKRARPEPHPMPIAGRTAYMSYRSRH